MNTLQGIVRFLLYALGAALVTGFIVWSAQNDADGLGLARPVTAGSRMLTTEYSRVEFVQHLLLLFCVLVFAWIALRDRLRRPLAIALAALFLIGLIRELDFFFDRFVVDNFWQVLAALPAAVTVVYLFRHRRRLEAGWHRSWPSAGLAIVIAGLILLLIFTQLLAKESVWEPTLGPGYLRLAPLAFEELSELGAYLIIAIGCCEFLYTWSRLPETRTMDNQRGRRRS